MWVLIGNSPALELKEEGQTPMPWNSQGGGGGGGPWGGGSGGGGNGGGQNPWGQGPRRPGGNGPSGPDLDDVIRKGQEALKSWFPGGGGGKGSIRGIALVGLALVGVWLASGLYRVQPGEQGVTMLFGKYYSTTGPGLNYHFPSPIGEVFRPNVEVTNQIAVGYRGTGDVSRGAASRDIPQESLMLTGDENIIDIDFVVQWRIKNAADYLFNIRDPEQTVKVAAESAMREVVGGTSLQNALTSGRQQIENDTRVVLQEVLDSYGAGIFIADLKLQQSDPPSEVIDAFNDVQRARQDQERAQNEAQAYANDIVPRAKGEAQRQIENATAYKERLIKEAEGEASRFLSVYETYKVAKDITTQRIYLETMQEVFSGTEKVLMDNDGGASGVVPYLPLPELRNRTQQSEAAQ
jgi:membrane protease subunit HflK